MKKYTRIAAVIMLLIFAVSYAKPLSAEEVLGSITVNGVESGRSVEVYKIFDLTYEGTHVSYTIDTDWAAFFSGTGAEFISDTNDASASLNPIIVDGTTKYINITESNAEAFADAALAYALTKEPDASQTATDAANLVFTDMALGYYLIYPVGASELSSEYSCVCSLDSTIPDATVNVKAIYPSIGKSEVASVVSAQVGQSIQYLIKGEVPNTTGYEDYTYIIRDTMTNLVYNKDFAMTVNGQTIDESLYTLSETETGFVVELDVMSMQDLRGSEIRIEYTASVSETAVVDGGSNSAALTYSSNPDRILETITTPSDEQKVYSSQIIIDKQDSENGKKLEGATFVLKNAEGQYYQYDEEQQMVSWVDRMADAKEFTTGESGLVDIIGLADGTYYLTETQAPDGYNKLTEDIVIEIQGDEENNVGASYTAVVKNNGGAELPSTGGIGTTIFYTAGVLLISLSLISMMLKNKKMACKKVR